WGGASILPSIPSSRDRLVRAPPTPGPANSDNRILEHQGSGPSANALLPIQRVRCANKSDLNRRQEMKRWGPTARRETRVFLRQNRGSARSKCIHSRKQRKTSPAPPAAPVHTV